MKNGAVAPTTLIASLPGCGECAAYSFLRMTGTAATLSEVSHRFRGDAREFDPLRVSMRHIRSVLTEYGVETEAVQYTNHSVEHLPFPCILFFRPGRFPGLAVIDSGHYLTATGLEGGEVRVFNWSPLAINHDTQMRSEVVSSFWDGEAIILKSRSRAVVWGSSILILGMMCLAWLIQRRQRIANEVAAATKAVFMFPLFACLLACMLGCGGTSPLDGEGGPLLTVKIPVLNLGVVSSQEDIIAKFQLEASTDIRVQIKEISKSCGCTTTDESLLGKWLNPGDHQELLLRIHPKGTVAHTEVVTAELITDPKSPVPIVVCVRYRPRNPPRISASQLLVESVIGRTQQVNRMMPVLIRILLLRLLHEAHCHLVSVLAGGSTLNQYMHVSP